MYPFRSSFRVPTLAKHALRPRPSILGCTFNRSISQSFNQSISQSVIQSVNKSGYSLFHSAAKLPTRIDLNDQPSINQPTNHSNDQSYNQSNNQSTNQSTKKSNHPVKLLLQIGGATVLVGLIGWHAASETQDIHSFLTQSINQSKLQINQFSSGIEIIGYHLSPSIIIICAINVAVFLAWRQPQYQFLLSKHFTYDLPSFLRGRWYTPLTSAFSHHGGLHLLFNMMALVSMAPSVQLFLSEASFSAFYLVSAFGSSLIGSLLTMIVFRGKPGAAITELCRPALGASGAVFAVFALNAFIFPDNCYRLMFIPYDIPASTLLPCLIGFDVAGLLYNRFSGKSSGLGHGAHLGGVLLGAAYYMIVLKNNVKLQQAQEQKKRQRQWQALQQQMKQPWQ